MCTAIISSLGVDEPVAEFICEQETPTTIAEALEMLHRENPTSNPAAFMMDCAENE